MAKRVYSAAGGAVSNGTKSVKSCEEIVVVLPNLIDVCGRCEVHRFQIVLCSGSMANVLFQRHVSLC